MSSYLVGDELGGRVYVCHGRVEKSVLVVIVMALFFIYEFVMLFVYVYVEVLFYIHDAALFSMIYFFPNFFYFPVAM
jgi:hypothetical protein